MLQPKQPEASSVQRRKILLVGAEPSIQALVSTFLTTMGWTCTVAPDTEKAPSALQEETFDAVVIDLGRSEADAEKVVLKIEQIRPSLAGRILAITNGDADRAIFELMERHDLIQLSHEPLLPQLWLALQESVVSPRARELSHRAMQPARMIFDSFRFPPPAGVRSSSSAARHMAFQHNKTIIDLSIELAKGAGGMSLTGQVLDHDKNRKLDSLSVVLVNGAGTLARTATNEFGEFHVECDGPQELSLEIRLGERSWVAVSLRKLALGDNRMSNRLAGT